MTRIISEKKISKFFGFNKDREGLITRYIKEKDNWQSHIQNTKKYILKASESKEKGVAVILGSGWWIDLPYEELSETFEKLFFIDITHPKQIIHKVKKFPKIELITADITGVLATLYKRRKENNKGIDELFTKCNNFTFLDNAIPDFVVSLNVLNQLSFFPKKYLLTNKIINNEDVDKIVRKIEQNHIDNLPENKSCLITDYLQYEYNSDNVLLKEQNRLQIQLPNNKLRKEWMWDFDLSGNFKESSKIKFKVAAIEV